MQLAPPTQPMTTSGFSSTQLEKVTNEEEEDAGSETLTTVLSIFGFLAACAVLAFQCMTVTVWDGWSELF